MSAGDLIFVGRNVGCHGNNGLINDNLSDGILQFWYFSTQELIKIEVKFSDSYSMIFTNFI